MSRRSKTDPAAKGIYSRKKSYWLRYTLDGVQHRVPLHTGDFVEAVEKAKNLRGLSIPDKTEKMVWDATIARYVSDKIAGRRPDHLRGKRLRTFAPKTTAPKTRSVLICFKMFCKKTSPQRVTRADLQKFYDEKRAKSESSARSQVIRVQAFLEHLHCLPGRAEFVTGAKPERREVVIEREESERWIRECHRDDLKFALFCGFHCGLRRAAIVHARPAWFAKDLSVVTVPAKEEQALANGDLTWWRNKDLEPCTIPLSREFREFLKGFLDRKALYCLHPDRCSKPYRWDFRSPFKDYVTKNEHPECTIHAMRHSWLTMLCNSGNHTITEIAAWSGDSIEVIERHYWKKRAIPGALDETMAGKRSGDTLKEVAASLKNISMSGLDRETVQAVQKLVTLAGRQKEPEWEWTEQVHHVHVKLYSIEDTVTKFGVFCDLIGNGDDPDTVVTTEDWEEGKVSTRRARLKTLENRGLIRRIR